jgi:hypothetical protein
MQNLVHNHSKTLLIALLSIGGVSASTITKASPDQTAPSFVRTPAHEFPNPTDTEVVALADHSIRAFMTSVRGKSMQTFWKHVSLQLQRKYSVAKLDAAFKEFYGLPISGNPLAGLSPIFKSRPVIDENRKLVVEGYYTTRPSQLNFRLVYKRGLAGR